MREMKEEEQETVYLMFLESRNVQSSAAPARIIIKNLVEHITK